MQHTFLPESDRAFYRRGYRLRLLIVLSAMLSLVCLIGIAMLIPAYVHARSLIAGETSPAGNTVSSGMLTAEQLNALTQDTAFVSAAQSDFSQPVFSSIIASIIAVKGPISITSLDAHMTLPGLTVDLQGLAATRDDLLSFQKRLQNIAPGAQADVPIAELAQSSNIEFSLEYTQPSP